MNRDDVIKNALRLATQGTFRRRGYAPGGTPTVGLKNPLTPDEEVQDTSPSNPPSQPVPNYGGFVNQLYQQNFGRAPDQQGADFWTQQLQGGVSAQDVASNFARSPEAQSMRGSDSNLPSQFVDTYKELSPLVDQYKIPNYYAPSNAQGDFLPNLTSTPATPGVTPGSGSTYTPTTPSLTPTTAAERGEGTLSPIPTWNPKIDNSGVQTPAFAPTLEQLQNNQIQIDPSNYKDFVTSLYNDYIGRAPDMGGQEYFMSQLAQGTSPADVAATIAASNEAQVSQLPTMFQQMLGREADQGGLNYYADMIKSGQGNLYDVAASMMNSPEYNSYQNQIFEANQSGFNPVNEYEFAARALKDGVGNTGKYEIGYLDPNVWSSGETPDVLPTSFAASILNKGLGKDQQLPPGYIDPNIMLNPETNVADKYQFAANALKQGLGENGVYKPYIDASINAQKVNDLIGNMDPNKPDNYVSGVYNALTGKSGDPAKIGELTAQLTAGNLSPAEIASYVAKENNVPLPPMRPSDLGQGPSTVAAPVERSAFDKLREVLGEVRSLPGQFLKTAGQLFTGPQNTISEGTKKVLDFISHGEGGYNAMNNGTVKGKIINSTQDGSKYLGKNPEDMTIKEIMDAQKGTPGTGRKLFAVGRYQIIPDTLRSLVKETGIDVNSKFDRETQDRLGAALIARRPGLLNYLTGKSNNIVGAMLDAAKEWASMPNPATGGSFYGSGNKSGHTVNSVRDMLQQARESIVAGKGAATIEPAIADVPLPEPLPSQSELTGETPAGSSSSGPPAGMPTDLTPISDVLGGFGGDYSGPTADVGSGSPSAPHTAPATHAPVTHAPVTHAPVTHTAPATHTGGGGSHVTSHGSGSVSFGPSEPASTGITHDISGTTIHHTSAADPYFGHGHFNPQTGKWMDISQARNLDPTYDYKRGGRVKRAMEAAHKPDNEDVENALRLAKRKGGRINTRIDKDPDFDMSMRLAKGGSPAWTRKEGQNPEGGLNAKGRASAKAEGSNLKPPAPRPKTDKDTARRKSFCSRMKGMKAKLTSSETANDPDSRINKSLRAWNCHSHGGAVDNALRIAKGGEVWNKPRPKGLGKPEHLSSSQKKSAKASAKAAGRPYPNLVDNMRAAQRKK